ncbi:MAG: TldD/PmbA family protein [Deltaproteobacteria bacterium]|nr:TldD/PmbA family protein [Deltaproteobacteria bacterium]
MKRTIAPILVLACLAAGAAGAADRGKDERQGVLKALEDELARSMDKLKTEDFSAPYFIAYTIRDTESVDIAGRFGAVTQSAANRGRNMHVDVRVGGYGFDNSSDKGDYDFSWSTGYRTPRSVPLDNDPLSIRNVFWLVTDEEYKAAQSAYLKKKGKGVYEVAEKDRPASFSREEKHVFVEPPAGWKFDAGRWEREVRTVTAMFKGHPGIIDSSMKVTADTVTRYFVNSEGSALITGETLYSVGISAVARAEDGMLLDNTRTFYARSAAGLPDHAKLNRETSEMIAELLALRNAPVLDPYHGPAILLPEATGVLFHEAVGHRLEGERQNSEKEGQTFKGQLGKKVLPAMVTLVDDPTLAKWDGEALNGHYRYDEEGVPAQKVTLVEKGVLKNFLLSRKPIKGFEKSNGHGRAAPGYAPAARMATLFVDAEEKIPYAELKRRLIEEVKRQGKSFGLILKNISGGSTNTSTYGYQAFKGVPKLVYRVGLDGKEELVRGVEMVGTPLASINKIMAVSDRFEVFNGFCGAESGYVPVSSISPAVLLKEIELQRVSKESEKPPLIPSPWAGGK